MNNQIESLSLSIQKDKDRLEKLQLTIKDKEKKLIDLKNIEILNDINIIESDGVDVKKALLAIKNKDEAALSKLINNKEDTPS